MSQQLNEKEAPIDQLVTLVEKAADTIERLQLEKAALAIRLEDHHAAAKTTVEELRSREDQIRVLEETIATLEKEVQWSRWFRKKYGDSTFFSHIEREYLTAHPSVQESTLTDGNATDTIAISPSIGEETQAA